MAVQTPDYRALAEVRYRIRRFLNFSEGAARSAGLEPQQHQLLLSIRGLPEGVDPTIGRIAERLQIQHHSAVELVSRCVEKDLVKKRTGARDRREVVLAITPRGRRLLEKLAVAHRSELRKEAPALSGALTDLLAADPALAESYA
jgi:DNA-binding MarR family transcriptional regulator